MFFVSFCTVFLSRVERASLHKVSNFLREGKMVNILIVSLADGGIRKAKLKNL